MSKLKNGVEIIRQSFAVAIGRSATPYLKEPVFVEWGMAIRGLADCLVENAAAAGREKFSQTDLNGLSRTAVKVLFPILKPARGVTALFPDLAKRAEEFYDVGLPRRVFFAARMLVAHFLDVDCLSPLAETMALSYHQGKLPSDFKAAFWEKLAHRIQTNMPTSLTEYCLGLGLYGPGVQRLVNAVEVRKERDRQRIQKMNARRALDVATRVVAAWYNVTLEAAFQVPRSHLRATIPQFIVTALDRLTKVEAAFTLEEAARILMTVWKEQYGAAYESEFDNWKRATRELLRLHQDKFITSQALEWDTAGRPARQMFMSVKFAEGYKLRLQDGALHAQAKELARAIFKLDVKSAATALGDLPDSIKGLVGSYLGVLRTDAAVTNLAFDIGAYADEISGAAFPSQSARNPSNTSPTEKAALRAEEDRQIAAIRVHKDVDPECQRNRDILKQMAAGGNMPRHKVCPNKDAWAKAVETIIQGRVKIPDNVLVTTDFMLPFRIIKITPHSARIVKKLPPAAICPHKVDDFAGRGNPVTDSDHLLRISVLLRSLVDREDLKAVLGTDARRALTDARKFLLDLAGKDVLKQGSRTQAIMLMHGFSTTHAGCVFHNRSDSWYDDMWWEVPAQFEQALISLASPHLVIHKAFLTAKVIRVTLTKQS